MKASSPNPFIRVHARPGYISYVMVLSLAIVLLTMLMGSFKTAMRSQESQARSQLRIDYSEKEEAILRSIIPIAANRAMLGMQHHSDVNSGSRTPLSWQKIFRSAILEAGGESSVEAEVLNEFEMGDMVLANPGDAPTWSSRTFRSFDIDGQYTSPGIDRYLGPGFPVPLQTDSATVRDRDHHWPVITTDKFYGSLAEGRVGASTSDYSQFNLIPYPQIRFGYAEPGQPFVAKRNWWAFNVDLADHQNHLTGAENRERTFVLSIYEVPSQLAISAEAFTLIGQHADGTPWQNTSIEGGVFATRAKVEEGLDLPRVASRRGLEVSPSAKIGGQFLQQDPFTPGVREAFELENNAFLPVYLSSEAGRAAFIPINRGIEFFDRFARDEESLTISTTTWDDYTIGAAQCAMHLDITEVEDENSTVPTELEFRYQKQGNEEVLEVPLSSEVEGLPPGFIYCADEHETSSFDVPVDVAYGANGQFAFEYGVSGDVTFENARFGDPVVGTFKAGYYRPSYPFEVTFLHDSKPCIAIYPERFANFLEAIGADDCTVNHSLSINVDYDGNAYLNKPNIPCTDLDYGVILRECADLSSFGKGFSLVTNLRLYIGDNFNTVDVPPPAGSGITSTYYPPCSLFAPEKRYGADVNPLAVKISGQMGSMAGDTGAQGKSVKLLDVRAASEEEINHDNIEVNLRPITHPAALPPVTMMNWLVVIEERKNAFYVEGNDLTQTANP